MKQNGAERLAVGGFNVSTTTVMIAASLMWLATAADRLFHLDWGWDRQILWTSPIVVIGTLLTRLIGGAIFRAIGATPPKGP